MLNADKVIGASVGIDGPGESSRWVLINLESNAAGIVIAQGKSDTFGFPTLDLVGLVQALKTVGLGRRDGSVLDLHLLVLSSIQASHGHDDTEGDNANGNKCNSGSSKESHS